MRLHHLLAGALLATGLCFAQNPAVDTVEQAPAAKAGYLQKPGAYPLSTCVVTGEELDAEAVTFEAGGRTFKTCCKKCVAKVEKDPATFAAKLDAAIVKGQSAHYPLTTCPVSGEKLGSMGESVQLVLDGTLVQLCCKKCSKKAMAEPAAMVQKVRDAAYAAQMKAYPLQTCIVSGKELGGDAVSAMFGNVLFRTCCARCVAKIEKDTAKFTARLHEAYKGAHAAPAKDGECCGGGGCGEGCCQGAEAKPAKGDKAKTDKKTDKADAGGECCESTPTPAKGEAKDKAEGGCCETRSPATTGPKGEKKVN
jgi:hypothetical protein